MASSCVPERKSPSEARERVTHSLPHEPFQHQPPVQQQTKKSMPPSMPPALRSAVAKQSSSTVKNEQRRKKKTWQGLGHWARFLGFPRVLFLCGNRDFDKAFTSAEKDPANFFRPTCRGFNENMQRKHLQCDAKSTFPGRRHSNRLRRCVGHCLNHLTY